MTRKKGMGMANGCSFVGSDSTDLKVRAGFHNDEAQFELSSSYRLCDTERDE